MGEGSFPNVGARNVCIDGDWLVEWGVNGFEFGIVAAGAGARQRLLGMACRNAI